MIIELQVEKNLSLVQGVDIVLVHDEGNKIYGVVVFYDKDFGQLKVDVTKTIGSGTFRTWTLFIVGPEGAPGPEGLAGLNGVKGEKGDKGDLGEQGVQGIAGGVSYDLKVVTVSSAKKYTVNDSLFPNLSFIRGFTYFFRQSDISNVGEKAFIATVGGTLAQANKYHINGTNLYSYSGAEGVDGKLTISVPWDAPDTLYYASETAGSNLGGIISVNNLGPKGETGEIGVSGKDGAIGPVGPQGSDGARGSAGLTGSQGERGLRGFQGPGGEGGTVGFSSGVISAGSINKEQAFSLYNSEINIKNQSSLSAADIDLVGSIMSEPIKLTSFKVFLRSNTLATSGTGDPSNKNILIRIYKNGIDAGIGKMISSSSLIGTIPLENDDATKPAELSLDEGDKITLLTKVSTLTGSGIIVFNYVSAVSVAGIDGKQGIQGVTGEKGPKGDTGSVNKEEMIKYVLIFG